MNYKKFQQSRALALALLTLGATSGVYAADEAVIQQSFHPYQNDKPSFAGLSAGMTINKGNVAQFKEILDPAFYGFIEKGWAELKVGDTTSFDLPASYVDATRQYMDAVKLGAKPGEISGAVAGRPFPRSRTPATRAPARSSPGTSSTATTGATAPPSRRSTGSSAI